MGGGAVQKFSRYRVSEFENMLGILASTVLLMGFRNDRSGTDDVKPEEEVPEDDDDFRRWQKRVKITHEKEIVEEDNIYQPHALAVIVSIFYNEQKTSELLALRFEFLAEIDVLCAGIEGASYGGVILMFCLPTCFLMALVCICQIR